MSLDKLLEEEEERIAGLIRLYGILLVEGGKVLGVSKVGDSYDVLVQNRIGIHTQTISLTPVGEYYYKYYITTIGNQSTSYIYSNDYPKYLEATLKMLIMR